MAIEVTLEVMHHTLLIYSDIDWLLTPLFPQRSTHRHAITRDIYNRLELKKIIRSEELGVNIDLLYQNNVPIRNLAEYISCETG